MLYCGYLPRLSMLYCKCDFFSILFVQSTSLVAMFYWFCFLMSMLYCNFDLVLVFPVLANVLVAMLYFGCLLRLSMLYCRFFFFSIFFFKSTLLVSMLYLFCLPMPMLYCYFYSVEVFPVCCKSACSNAVLRLFAAVLNALL